MSIEDDIALLSRVPSFNLLGMSAIQVLAIGAEQRDFEYGDELFHAGDVADSGFVVRSGSFRVAAEGMPDVIADPLVLDALQCPRSRKARSCQRRHVPTAKQRCQVNDHLVNPAAFHHRSGKHPAGFDQDAQHSLLRNQSAQHLPKIP